MGSGSESVPMFLDGDHREWVQSGEDLAGQERADLRLSEREEPERAARPLAGRRCVCGWSSNHPYCPQCGTRLRPARSAVEVEWIRVHGFELLPADRAVVGG